MSGNSPGALSPGTPRPPGHTPLAARPCLSSGPTRCTSGAGRRRRSRNCGRRRPMRRVLGSVIVATLAIATSSAADRPNVVVILTDDQGWGDLSLNGNTNLRTPNIDSLAKDGARFDRFFVQPVCSPTRAEFLTGRYHPRGGVRDVSTGGERLNLDEKTIAAASKAAGSATGCFAKCHNGSKPPSPPNPRGFDEYSGFTPGHWGHYFSPPLDHNGQLVTGNGFIADDLTDRAIGFIDKHRDGPF